MCRTAPQTVTAAVAMASAKLKPPIPERDTPPSTIILVKTLLMVTHSYVSILGRRRSRTMMMVVVGVIMPVDRKLLIVHMQMVVGLIVYAWGVLMLKDVHTRSHLC